jgi:hypothetical protein
MKMKGKMAKVFSIGGAILAFTCVAGASTTFNYTGSAISPGPGNIAETVGGITATAWAVWANYDSSGSTVVQNGANAYGGTQPANANFATTWLAEYQTNGLAVCNPNEQPSCGVPEHQIDNYHGLEFVLIGFSAAVNLNSVQVQNYGSPTGGSADVDLSYAVLSASQESSLLGGTLAFNSIAFTTLTSSNLTSDTYTLTGAGQYLLIGTAVTGNYGGDSTPDAFKIQNVIVNPASVPEPSSVFLIGSGLIAAAYFGKRRLNK